MGERPGLHTLVEAAFVAGLRDLGYVAGRNLVLESDTRAATTAECRLWRTRSLPSSPTSSLLNRVGCHCHARQNDVYSIVLIASRTRGGRRVTRWAGTMQMSRARPTDELVAKHVDLLSEIVPKMLALRW